MKHKFCFLLIVLLSFDLSLGKVFTRCEFAKELHGHGMTRKEIQSWTCIAEYMTGFNTSATRGPFEDGSKTHGPFLISDRWWCKEGSKKSENFCNVKCKGIVCERIYDIRFHPLRSSRISASVNCARKIYSPKAGYWAWDIWADNCENKLPNLDSCFSK